MTTQDPATTPTDIENELCLCGSDMVKEETIDGELWKVCLYQGCSQRISGARHYFHPGDGKAPKKKKIKKVVVEEEVLAAE